MWYKFKLVKNFSSLVTLATFQVLNSYMGLVAIVLGRENKAVLSLQKVLFDSTGLDGEKLIQYVLWR